MSKCNQFEETEQQRSGSGSEIRPDVSRMVFDSMRSSPTSKGVPDSGGAGFVDFSSNPYCSDGATWNGHGTHQNGYGRYLLGKEDQLADELQHDHGHIGPYENQLVHNAQAVATEESKLAAQHGGHITRAEMMPLLREEIHLRDQVRYFEQHFRSGTQGGQSPPPGHESPPPPTENPPPGHESPPPPTETPPSPSPTDNPLNAGVPKDAALTTHVGNIVVTQPGEVIQNLDVHGQIIVEAAGVTIKNCIVRGDPNVHHDTAMIDCNSAKAKNVLIDHCTLAPSNPTIWTDGVIGHDYTANAVNTYNVVDGFGVYNNTGDKKYTNVTIENSYVHDLAHFTNDYPNHTDGTHNDGIQVQGGGNIQILNNDIQAFESSTAGTKGGHAVQASSCGILIQGNVSPVFGLKVENNTVDGGSVSINVSANADGALPIGDIAYNRIGHDQRVFGHIKLPIRIQSVPLDKFTKPLETNVWEDTGKPLSEGEQGGIIITN